MKTSKLLALAITGAIGAAATTASAFYLPPPKYQTFAPWHLGIMNDSQCLNSSFVYEWQPCAGTVGEAVQFESLSSATYIQSFWGYAQFDSQYNQVSFSSFNSMTHEFFLDGSGYLQDAQTGACVAHDGDLEIEAPCGFLFFGPQATMILEQGQNPPQMYAYWPAMGQNLVLDLEGNDATTGQPLDVTGANGTTAQDWEWSGLELQLKRDTSWCMTASSPDPGASIYVAKCGSVPYQSWSRVAPNQVVLYYTESCLEAPLTGSLPTYPGTYLTLGTCNGSLNQQFSTPY